MKKKAKPARQPAAPAAPPPTTNLLEQAVEVYRIVSDETRLAILIHVSRAGRLNVGELCAALGDAQQSAISHHLAILRHAKMVRQTREGRFNYYTLPESGSSPLVEAGALLGRLTASPSPSPQS